METTAADKERKQQHSPSSRRVAGNGASNKQAAAGKRSRSIDNGASASTNHDASAKRQKKSGNKYHASAGSFPGFVDPPYAKPQSSRSHDSNKQPPRQSNDNGARRGNRRRGRNRRGRSKKQRESQQAGWSQPMLRPMRPIGRDSSLNDDLSSCEQTLCWHTFHPHVPVETEQALLPTLLKHKARERGMIRNAGEQRYREISAALGQQVGGIRLSQALSLRRQHMRHMNPRIPMTALGLGSDANIRQSAALFESAIEAYMKQQHQHGDFEFLTERQQRAALPRGVKTPPTPDFILPKPTRLSVSSAVDSSVTSCHAREQSTSQSSPHHPADDVNSTTTSTTSESDVNRDNNRDFVIHWVEAKMFYGASSLCSPVTTSNNSSSQNDSTTTARTSSGCSAVGQVLSTAQKYVDMYGTGAMVFMYGCGKELAKWLLQIGVVALDVHPSYIDLTMVENHQRTWCANKNGLILP